MFFPTKIRLLFLLSFLMVFIPGILYLVQLAYVPKVNASKSVEKKIEKKYYVPTKIIIPKIEIDLPIEQTVIADGAWEISENGASHLATSARPGERGTIIMYGHNTNDRFGPIRWLIIGDHIELVTADGRKHVYAIYQTMQVKPEKLDIFTQQKGETLILYTCDSYGDLERFVILAKPL